MSGGHGITIVRLTHSAVVDEYRERERVLQRDYGYRVHIVSPPAWDNGGYLVPMEPDPEIDIDVIPIYGRTKHPILYWFNSRRLRRILREQRPEIIDLHEEPYSLSCAAALRAIRTEAPAAKICIYTAQNILKRYPPPFRQMEEHALRACRAAYPCSTEAGDVLRTKGFQGDLHVIPLGVALEPAREVSAAIERVIYVGRLETYKGVEIALEAFARSSVAATAELEFLGNGPVLEALREQARALGIADRVTFPGPVAQDEALRRIRAADVILIPSLTTPTWKEQFGRVAAQALAAGTAVVASDSGSLREVVGDAGELVPEGDVNGFADALDRLAAEPGRRAELARAGQARAAERFSWNRVAADVDAMYTGMLQSA